MAEEFQVIRLRGFVRVFKWVTGTRSPYARALWSSQGLVETLSKRLMSGLELLRADAAEMTVTAH